MANGFAGKILRVNLTTRQIGTIDTAKYEEFGGGYGIGTALFWELAVAPGEWDLQDAYDPRNVIALMTGPLAATGVPAAGRTSVCGLSPEVFPTQYSSQMSDSRSLSNRAQLLHLLQIQLY